MSREFFPEFIDALAKSEAGASLKKTYRWSQFRTAASNETWKKFYGATGQVFTHSILFFNDARWFLRMEKNRFTDIEAETFLYGVAPHDLGEAKVSGSIFVGDVGAHAKTSADEKKEVKVAYTVIKSLDLPDETRGKLLDGYQKVIEGADPKLQFAFKALEKSEYVFTAMKLYSNSKRLKGKLAIENVEPMVGRVLVFDLPKVLDVYAPAFPDSIGCLFKNAIPLIDEMFAYSLPWLEKTRRWNGKEVDHKAKAEEFKLKWEAFKAS